MSDTGIFGSTGQESQGHTPSHPEYVGYVSDTAIKAGRPIEPEIRMRTTPPDFFDHLFSHNASVAYYVEYAAVFFVYGVIGLLSVVLVLELTRSIVNDLGLAITLGATAGIYAVIIGLVVHPWMRKHLPKKDA